MDWTPPSGWLRIRTIDAHAEGEPLRVILDGFPQPRGRTVLERRRDAGERLDHLRRLLMWEPRGHADMYGCLLMPPTRPGPDIAVLFLHNDGFSTMCGHGIIALAAVLVALDPPGESDIEASFSIETPAGLVRASATVSEGYARRVRFVNVPSFATALDRRIHVPGYGDIAYDVGYGGAFYAFVDAPSLGLELVPGHAERLIAAGRDIKRAIADSAPPRHPTEPELGFLYGVIFTGPARGADGRHSRHACVFADGELDRSPTGTGVSARLAILRARGEIESGTELVIESLIGGRFTGRIVDEGVVDGHASVIPEIGGRAFVTGRHEFVLDPRDPWPSGFLVR